MSDFDNTVKLVRNKLTPVRDIILHIHSILIWQKPYYAPCIIMLVTFIFMSLWLITVPTISKFCFIGIIVTLLDYFLPFLNALVAFPKWEEKEPLFNTLCELIARTWLDLRDFYYLFSSWKTSKTKLYYTILLSSLVILAWIGTKINNLLLFYLLTMVIVLYPGLSHYNMIEQISRTNTIQKYTKSLFKQGNLQVKSTKIKS